MKLPSSKWVWLPLLFLWFMMPATVCASFDAACRVLVAVTHVHPPAKPGHLGSGLKLSFKVRKIIKQWGHDKAYCDRIKMLGKRYVAVVGFYKKGPSYKKVKAGTWLYLDYQYSHDDGPKGATKHTSWLAKAFYTSPKPRRSRR